MIPGVPRSSCLELHSVSSFDSDILIPVGRQRTGSEPPSREPRMSDSHTAERRSKSAVASERSRRIGTRAICCVVFAMCIGTISTPKAGGPSQSSPERVALRRPTLTDAQSLFYNARYEEAAGLALALRVSDAEDLASVELRSSA